MQIKTILSFCPQSMHIIFLGINQILITIQLPKVPYATYLELET